MDFMRFCRASAASAALVICAPMLLAAPGAATAEDWISPLSRDHPLVGKVWNPAAAAFVSPETAIRAAGQAAYLALGEKHDNADHHRLQARIIAAMAENGRRPAIIFEMIDEDRQGAIDAWRATKPTDGAGLGPAVAWDKSGWPDFSIYRPIADAAVAANLPILGGDLPRDLLRAVAREGFAALDAARVKRLGLDRDLPAAMEKELRTELYESHCRLLPERAMSPMVAVQRSRDAVLGERMVAGAAAPNADGAVLIAGAEHARLDRGAPATVKLLDSQRSVAAIAFIEVADGETDPAAYGEYFGGTLPFDFVWFTPRANDRDHCAEFKRSREKGG